MESLCGEIPGEVYEDEAVSECESVPRVWSPQHFQTGQSFCTCKILLEPHHGSRLHPCGP